MNWTDLQKMLWTGGPLLVATKLLIVAGSIGSVVVAIERALLLRGFSARARELHEQVIRALLRGDGAQARHECDRSQLATANIYRSALDRAGKPEKIPDAVDRARREVVHELRGPLWVLATMGAVMPFVGLFGTVIGILASFAKLKDLGGTPAFNVVAGDISEALITTAAGILVAVEAVVFYNYFQAKVGKEAFAVGLQAEETAELVMDKAAELAAPTAAKLTSAAPAAAAATAPRTA
jgi:biopolymer transport protein ExbB/TolQ